MIYPTGTILTMRRLSQAALCGEIFPDETIFVFKLGEYYFETSFNNIDYSSAPLNGFNHAYIVVAEKNQKWLSPEPVAGDLVSACQWDAVLKKIINNFFLKLRPGFFQITDEGDNIDIVDGTSPLRLLAIENRSYPNGTRAPLIKFENQEKS